MNPWTPIQARLEERAATRLTWIVSTASAVIKALLLLTVGSDDTPLFPRWGY
jgi:hypothetical protein